MDIKFAKNFFDNSRIVKDGWINGEWIKKHIENTSLPINYINQISWITCI